MTNDPASDPRDTRLQRLVQLLLRLYGAPPQSVTTDPFGLILWEQVGYLVTDDQRLKAFRRLETEVGLSPEEISRAPESRLVDIARTGGGVAVQRRAQRMQASAEMAIKEWRGDLMRLLEQPESLALRSLTKFPMIGLPGAEKILLITRRRRGLPLESNGLRVLLRLGYGTEAGSYAATYREVQSHLGTEIRADYRWLLDTHYLLRQHGKELCKQSSPRCSECPLVQDCSFDPNSTERDR